MTKLTAKQQKFVDCYLTGMSQSDAYRAAYSTKNMSDRVIHAEATKLAKNPKVSLCLAEYQSERSKRTNFDADKVLIHLADVISADISDIICETTHAYKPIHSWPKIWRQMVQNIGVTELFEGKGKDRKKIGEFTSYTFINRTKAIELVGKHVNVGAFAEKLQVEVVDRASVLEKAKKRAENAAHVH